MLDLFCGRWGWGSAFAARGWEVVGVDLTEPPEIPEGCTFIKADVMTLTAEWVRSQGFDFICASSPCEQFSVHGMKHFHPNPKHPELGLRLFNHTLALCEASGLPYVMENVRSAEKFVGRSVNHCGPFYLWGTGVPAIFPKDAYRVTKGMDIGSGQKMRTMTREQVREYRRNYPILQSGSKSKSRCSTTAEAAKIPTVIASTVADYAERLIEVAQ